jgi:hypothetical protein
MCEYPCQVTVYICDAGELSSLQIPISDGMARAKLNSAIEHRCFAYESLAAPRASGTGISDRSVIIGSLRGAEIAGLIAQVCANNVPNNQAE